MIPDEDGWVRIRLTGRPASKQQTSHNGTTVFQSKQYRAWERDAKRQLKALWTFPPIDSLLRVDIVVHRSIPKGTSAKKTAEMLLQPCVPGMDWDNCAKSICDPLNGIVWVDDKQIVDGRLRRVWSETDRVVVRLREVSAITTPSKQGAA